MNRYRVTVTLQARDNDPVEVVYARDVDAMGALHAVTSAYATHVSDPESPFPTTVVSVRIDALPVKEA